eukprot:CAMPEP_0202898080 /NCGR_PEP_ID=MMETSP1392-20130828/6690_1 /ASSEMBLY_ACC=CAM_ASM_000868 /TAXON_ID=225041 /ORGANISM="Chlamydomonas chlamydogama, Strain SAG 11-48b" /LENGTH=119 /DNA_ID=CAMNT_0049583907 /DNA_START=33 /DNA_END=393 /DNA_ORIENTATION=-
MVCCGQQRLATTHPKVAGGAKLVIGTASALLNQQVFFCYPPRARGEAVKIVQEAEGYKQEVVSKAEGDMQQQCWMSPDENLNRKSMYAYLPATQLSNLAWYQATSTASYLSGHLPGLCV